MNLQAIVCTNGSAFILLLVVLQSSRRISRHGTLDYKLVNIMLFTALILCVVETVSYLNNGITEPGHRELEYVLKVTEYMGNSLFAFMWAVYADFKLFSDVNRLKRRYSILVIPALLIMLASIINFFTPVFFEIDPITCVYRRSGLYIIPNIVVFFYLMYGTVLIYKNKDKVGKYLFLPAVIFMLPIILGATLDFLFYGIELKLMGIAIALNSIFINVQNEMSYTDSLSGLLTRQYMVNYLLTEKSRISSGKKVAGIMLDIDQFKTINDTYGHLVGDEAIGTVGQLLHDIVSEKDLAVRFAGDEFVIIKNYHDKKEVQELVLAIHAAAEQFNQTTEKPYRLQFSVGSSFFDKNKDTIDTFLERMDTAMYEEKKTKHIAG